MSRAGYVTLSLFLTLKMSVILFTGLGKTSTVGYSETQSRLSALAPHLLSTFLLICIST